MKKFLAVAVVLIASLIAIPASANAMVVHPSYAKFVNTANGKVTDGCWTALGHNGWNLQHDMECNNPDRVWDNVVQRVSIFSFDPKTSEIIYLQRAFGQKYHDASYIHQGIGYEGIGWCDLGGDWRQWYLVRGTVVVWNDGPDRRFRSTVDIVLSRVCE